MILVLTSVVIKAPLLWRVKQILLSHCRDVLKIYVNIEINHESMRHRYIIILLYISDKVRSCEWMCTLSVKNVLTTPIMYLGREIRGADWTFHPSFARFPHPHKHLVKYGNDRHHRHVTTAISTSVHWCGCINTYT